MDQYKTCTKCLENKILDSFGNDKTRKDGKFPHCKDCVKAASRTNYANNKNKIKLRVKAYSELNKDKKYEANKKWRLANAEKNREYQKLWAREKRKRKPLDHRRWPADKEKLASWRKNNPEKYRLQKLTRRAREKNAKQYLVTSKEILKMLSANCYYCQKAPAKHVDHVIPISKGGLHSIGNLVGACAKCNLTKSDNFISVWRFKNA
jgi:5-methylcytosine-specific restriction endonuclease McrA